MSTSLKTQKRISRKRRIRSKITGTSDCPRLSVFRSLTTISAQIIDDSTGTTLASASTKILKLKPNMAGAVKLGEELGKLAKTKKISTLVFDRNGYRYHGRIAAFANAVREAGITF